ncbi:MAG: HflC protein [Candidatus Omnitrophica bacterium CG11_big_fil_rev_8_21_14_0_20_64_10]|nr:MAG: HflC protein [Candidatus Omnitrophica bacterium CG11_big_fil_rev_8_21_14_0_20_64_10]
MKRLLPMLAAFLALIAANTVFIIDETEQAIVTRLGEYKRTIQEPGLKAKLPFVETVYRYDRRILVSDADPDEYLTGDKKRVAVDHITRWQIVDPLAFFKTMQFEARGGQRLADIVVSGLRRELALHEFTDVISKKRDTITAAVAKNSSVKAKEFGIEVRDVRIKRADLPREVQESVFQRMVAERDRIAKRYRSEGAEESAKIRAQTDKEKAIILAEAYKKAQLLEGEGDAEATAIYAAAYGQDPELYRFIRSLETYEDGFREGSVLVLSGDEEFLQYLADSRKNTP